MCCKYTKVVLAGLVLFCRTSAIERPYEILDDTVNWTLRFSVYLANCK